MRNIILYKLSLEFTMVPAALHNQNKTHIAHITILREFKTYKSKDRHKQNEARAIIINVLIRSYVLSCSFCLLARLFCFVCIFLCKKIIRTITSFGG